MILWRKISYMKDLLSASGPFSNNCTIWKPFQKFREIDCWIILACMVDPWAEHIMEYTIKRYHHAKKNFVKSTSLVKRWFDGKNNDFSRKNSSTTFPLCWVNRFLQKFREINFLLKNLISRNIIREYLLI